MNKTVSVVSSSTCRLVSLVRAVSCSIAGSWKTVLSSPSKKGGWVRARLVRLLNRSNTLHYCTVTGDNVSHRWISMQSAEESSRVWPSPCGRIHDLTKRGTTSCKHCNHADANVVMRSSRKLTCRPEKPLGVRAVMVELIELLHCLLTNRRAFTSRSQKCCSVRTW